VGGLLMNLMINKEVINSTTIFKLEGMLDISTANVIQSCLDEINKIDSLIVDFSGLEFIDSTGIGAIMNAIYLSQEKGFRLKLQGINELTHEVFETVGLYKILEVMQGEVA
jgi:anti-anti-sigma factor